ncbi:MAG: TrlF family ATPase, partial [Balneola sp.]
MTKFPKGSEWRKWDLHIHSPASFYWNGTKKLWEMTPEEKISEIKNFIEILNDSDVEVFCLMDYWTFDWYLLLQEYLNENPEELNKTVFPGIELRVECPVDYRLNIHCILSNDLSKQEIIDFKSELYIRSIDKKLSDDSLKRFALSLDESK